MGRSRKNFLSLLENDKVGIFCAFDKDYNVFRAKIHNENLFSHLGFKDIENVFLWIKFILIKLSFMMKI